MDTLAIIKRIELKLTELGMSKAEFYEKSGISSASYSQWNTGKYNQSNSKLRQAADVLGLDFDYLCFGSVQTENAPGLTEKDRRNISNDDLKFALWGTCENVTDEDLDDVRRYAAFVRERKKK